MIKLAAKDLRHSPIDEEAKKKLRKNPIYIVLDNVLDTYNIGAIFRLADAVAATKVILCAGSETPPNTRIKKASINTTEWVDWEYAPTAAEAIRKLRKQFSTPPRQTRLRSNNKFSSSSESKTNREVKGIQVISVELDKRAVPYTQVDYKFPVAIVVGHETDGVSEEVMKMSDYIVELPMYGVNISLNVMVSLGIVLYEVVRHLKE